MNIERAKELIEKIADYTCSDFPDEEAELSFEGWVSELFDILHSED